MRLVLPISNVISQSNQRRNLVKKIKQRSKPEVVMNEGRQTRARRIKEQKKKKGLNDSSNSSISILLRKLLVALKGIS